MWQEIEIVGDDSLIKAYLNVEANLILAQGQMKYQWLLAPFGNVDKGTFITEESKDALLAGMYLSQVREYRAMVGKQYKGVLITEWNACAGELILANGERVSDYDIDDKLIT